MENNNQQIKNMKSIVFFLAVFFISGNVFAQTYHVNNAGNPVQTKKGNTLKQNVFLDATADYSEKLINIVTSSLLNSSSLKTDFSYNEKNQVVQSGNWLYDNITQAWNGQTRSDFVYNGSGEIIEQTTVNVNPELAGLGNDVRYQYNYDNSGLLKELIISTKANGESSWSVNTKTTYTYGASNRLEEENHWIANFFTGTLEYTAKTEHLYNENGVLTEQKFYMIEPTTQITLLSGKSEFVFNQDGYVQQQIDYEADDMGVLQFSDKLENTFDAYGCISETETFSYDLNANAWLNDSKSISTYDHSVTTENLLIPWTFMDNSSYKLTDRETFVWEASQNTWVKTQHSTYNYAGINATIADWQEHSDLIEVYPNPAQKYIRIKNAEIPGRIEISAVNGKILFHKEIHHADEQIGLNGLIPGMYFYSVTSKNKTSVGKILIQ